MKTRYKILFVLVLLFVLLCVFFVSFGVPLFLKFERGWHISQLGAYGDVFGSFNSLMSALAFIGLLITIYLQKKELSAAQETARLECFENTFYHLVDLYKSNLNEISINVNTEKGLEEKKGIAALSWQLKQMKNNLKIALEKCSYNSNCNKYEDEVVCADRQIVYGYHLHKVIAGFMTFQTRYLSTIKCILRHIVEFKDLPRERNVYVDIFLSQFTSFELQYLFYTTYTLDKNDKFIYLMKELNFLEKKDMVMNVSNSAIMLYNQKFGTKLTNRKLNRKNFFSSKIYRKANKRLSEVGN